MGEGGESDKLKGKGADRARLQKEQDVEKFSGKLKGRGLKEDAEADERPLEVGTILVNRDMALSNPADADYVIESATGELGKRHFVLRAQNGRSVVSKGEESLKGAIQSGVWSHKE